jgi:putative ABC transport system permease protein
MKLLEGLIEASDAILHNKLRTFLSLLGMVIGTASVVAVISAGAMLRSEFIDQADSIGARLIPIYRNWEIREDGTRSVSMNGRDVEAMKALVPDAQFARLIYTQRQATKGKVSKSASVVGCDPEYWDFWPKPLAGGRMLDSNDEAAIAKVAVLTQDLAAAYFPEGNAVGGRIMVGAFDYTVVGVIAKQDKVSLMGDGMDRETILLPYAVVERTMDWGAGQPRVLTLMARAASVERVEATAAACDAYLRRIYGEVDGKNRFKVEALESALKVVRNIFAAVSGVVAFIAGISLLVSGIGIMNVMLVAVSERTREIGIRKAVGARRSDILAQFLVESLYVCLAGGFMGLALGGAIAKVASLALRWAFVFPWTAPLAALGVSSAIGLFFGLQPAMSASRLPPVQALSQE